MKKCYLCNTLFNPILEPRDTVCGKCLAEGFWQVHEKQENDL